MAYQAPENYRALTTQTVSAYLADKTKVSALLGGSAQSWTAEEVGDGNLNLVFIVRNGDKSVIAKQALPYVRLVGESWPLPLSRAYFEYQTLKRESDVASQWVPEIILYDHEMALIVMEHLTPHIILRKGLIQGIRYPHLADHAGQFMAATLFDYSDLCLDAKTKKLNVALFSENHVMCGLTEQVIFDDPYFEAELNRHTSPQLDDIAADIRQDVALKVAVQELKTLFMCKAQTLLHGDLHSGSIMVTEADSRVIDPEFAFYGPMGFDVGVFIANLLLAYFSQPGHATSNDDREDYGQWILETLLQTYAIFEKTFSQKWRDQRTGALYPETLFSTVDTTASEQALSGYLRDVMQDSIGFAGAEMVRRILGIAHVEDLETITNENLRAKCERKALSLGRIMITTRKNFSDLNDIAGLARKISQE